MTRDKLNSILGVESFASAGTVNDTELLGPFVEFVVDRDAVVCGAAVRGTDVDMLLVAESVALVAEENVKYSRLRAASNRLGGIDLGVLPEPKHGKRDEHTTEASFVKQKKQRAEGVIAKMKKKIKQHDDRLARGENDMLQAHDVYEGGCREAHGCSSRRGRSSPST